MSYQEENRRVFGNIPFFLAVTLVLAFTWGGLVTSSWGQPAWQPPERPAELLAGQPAEQLIVRHGQWMAGDFHQHTLYSDGSFSMSEVMTSGFRFGLDWQANSDHGGTSLWNENKLYWDDPSLNTIFLGNDTSSDGHRLMWRWQNLRDYAYPQVVALRAANPDKLIASALEWNIPGHEHCLVGIIANDGQPISDFEYMSDRMDKDTSRDMQKKNGSPIYRIFERNNRPHLDAVAAAAWLQANYRYTSWLIPAHPERLSSYDIADFRDFNNAAPDVAFGFEGMPGHQKAKIRGDYCIQSNGGGTYGGAGCNIAKIGGLWDALLGEGRVWSTFANSDFHNTDREFWPGEYTKNYTFVQDKNGDGRYSLEELVDGLRSGNSFCVTGDLINALDFSIQAGNIHAGDSSACMSKTPHVQALHVQAGNSSACMGKALYVQTGNSSACMGKALYVQPGNDSACMGQTLYAAKGDSLLITIRFKSPQINSHEDSVKLDHLDLIAGEVTGKINPSNRKAYQNATNQSTRLLARFTEQDWKEYDGWQVIEYALENVDKDMYFRLRGTNLGLGVKDETDMEGNPLKDAIVIGSDDNETSWADLWFYSNAIFVDVRESGGRNQKAEGKR